jgi:hypothetical protein
MEQGGSISGTVFDIEGNPLGGIAVDIEDGGYGACTDEDGYYQLTGLPFGTYNVVAGLDFCNPHPYTEGTAFDITIDANTPELSDVDFLLDIAAPPPPNYMIIAQPDHEWVASHGWPVGETVKLSIEDDEWFETAAPAEWDPSIGTVLFDWEDWGSFDLTPDMTVIITNGTVTESLQVELHSILSFEESTGIVTGSAPSGRTVGVGVHQPNNDFWMEVLSDGDGAWTANFGDGVFSGVFDVHALIWDEDGDATQANYDLSN